MKPQAHPAICIAWRHPRPVGAEGRCIGRTDLAVDRRKAKRLAHRIRQAARAHGWQQEVYTSPLARCAQVGRQLKRWGWRHHIDLALQEMDFGRWDGQAWSRISRDEVDTWCAHFLDHAPGGGESLRGLFARVATWRVQTSAPASAQISVQDAEPQPRLVVAHAGWMLAHRWLDTHATLPNTAAQWPAPPPYGTPWQMGADHGR